MRQHHFWVIGGDPRFAALARALAEDGHTVHTYALERAGEPGLAPLEAGSLAGVRDADCVLLPLPVNHGEYVNAPLSGRRLPLHTLLDALAPGQLVCAGRVDEDLKARSGARGLTLIDYFEREELAVANAVPAALPV